MIENKITESAIETFAMELLEKQGYRYNYGPAIAPDSETPERASFEDVLLIDKLKKAVARINPTISSEVRADAIKQIERLASPELIANNEAFHRMLTEGIKVNYQKDGNNRGDLVWLVDWNNPENNDFVVLNQCTIIENHSNKRPDVILFVNGLPLVVIELKNPADENATIHSAFKQIQTYKQAAKDIITHFEQRQEVMEGKGMIVTMSRRIATELYKAIIDLKPQWHNEDLKKDKLRELAVVLYAKVKENASIDWTIKESVKAKLKVKRILRQYGYPPDMQMLATETVLKQAELIEEELTHDK